MRWIQRASTAAVMVVIAILGFAVTTAAPALAAGPCVPAGTFVDDITVTVCVTDDSPAPGYPSVGAYSAPHGYVQVCRGTSCPVIFPFGLATTGVAVVPNQARVVPTAGGTPIPNLCVGTTCTPTTVPGYQVVLFEDPAVLILQVNGVMYRYDLPRTCLSTAGTC